MLLRDPEEASQIVLHRPAGTPRALSRSRSPPRWHFTAAAYDQLPDGFAPMVCQHPRVVAGGSSICPAQRPPPNRSRSVLVIFKRSAILASLIDQLDPTPELNWVGFATAGVHRANLGVLQRRVTVFTVERTERSKIPAACATRLACMTKYRSKAPLKIISVRALTLRHTATHPDQLHQPILAGRNPISRACFRFSLVSVTPACAPASHGLRHDR